ncbi:TPA: discoidin domain-containing protein [Serratia liquefaciens]|jgi:hypothetical protein|nr:discoidin domain-containing protein [Serratia liquefaciens]
MNAYNTGNTLTVAPISQYDEIVTGNAFPGTTIEIVTQVNVPTGEQDKWNRPAGRKTFPNLRLNPSAPGDAIYRINVSDSGTFKLILPKLFPAASVLTFINRDNQGKELARSDITVDYAEQRSVNMEGVTAVASSEWPGNYKAQNMLDNDDKTRWSATYTAKEQAHSWFIFNFPRPTTLNGITLKQYAPRITNYTLSIQTENGWVPIKKEQGKLPLNAVLLFPQVTTVAIKLEIDTTEAASIYSANCWLSERLDLTSMSDEQILEDLTQRIFYYYWSLLVSDESDPMFGFPRTGKVINIAAVGYYLNALIIGAERGYKPRTEVEKRAIGLLKTLKDRVANEEGIFYHFISTVDGSVEWDSDASPADTAIMFGPIVAAGEYFGGQAKEYASVIYNRLGFDKAIHPLKITTDNPHRYEYALGYNPAQIGQANFYQGYTMKKNGTPWTWSASSEIVPLYFYAAGAENATTAKHVEMYRQKNVMSKTRAQMAAINPAYEDAFERTGKDKVFISYFGQLFISHTRTANLDFRAKQDADGINWAKNCEILYRIAHQFAIAKQQEYRAFNDKSWGVNANNGPRGYMDTWGQDPAIGFSIDGTMTPNGATNALALARDIAMPAVRNYYVKFPQLIGEGGFYQSFNLDHSYPDEPLPYFSTTYPDYDKGAEISNIENARTGLIWKYTMKNERMQNAFENLGFVAELPISNVKNVTLTAAEHSLTITLENVEEILSAQDYQFIYVYDSQGNRVIEPSEMKNSIESHQIENLEPDTEYTFKIIRMKNGSRSEPRYISAKTLRPRSGIEESADSQ